LSRSRRSTTDLPEIAEEDRRLIDRFVDRLRRVPEVQAVVLFGSFARRDVDRRSDVDLLVVVDRPDPGALRPLLARIVSEMKPHREINPTLTNLRDAEPSFLRAVFREGVVLHGKLLLTPDGLAVQPRVLLAYDLTPLEPAAKVRISRMIHGFSSIKKVRGRKRTYRYPGLRERPGATLVSRSVLLLSPDDAAPLVRELDAHRVPYARWDVYV
jgi:predicted nucleotidyltransferase